MQRDKILIYQDYIHNNGILHRSLSRHYGAQHIRFCDADDIVNGCLEEGIHLLVMPGGADLYFCEKLNGAGNDKIREYVEGGGNYFGICAGAYYACRNIEWAKGTEQEIAGPRELDFYDGTATGPVTEFIENGDVNQNWKHAAELEVSKGRTGKSKYNGGPVFSEPQDRTARVLARYTELKHAPPAIIETDAGAGRAVLCGPHIEFIGANTQATLYKHLNPSYERERLICNDLQDYEQFHTALFSFCLQRFEQGRSPSGAA